MVEQTFIESSVQEIADATISRLLAAGLIDLKKKEKQPRINWERLLAYEYVNKFYGDLPHWFRIEVGPIPGGQNNPLYARTRRWADAVVRMPDHMLLMEFKMKAEPQAVSQLEMYERLFPETPIFKKYKDEPLKIRIVCAMIDEKVHEYIESRGIDVEIYKPSNFEAWYKQIILKEAKS